jgi:hypothetical protein
LYEAEFDLAWMIFRLTIAEVLSFTAFYVILSKALGKEKKAMCVVVSACLSIFCFQRVAELFNHLSEYVTLASLSIFLFALIYDACRR